MIQVFIDSHERAIARGDTTAAKERKAGRLVQQGTRGAFDRFWTIFDGAGLPGGSPSTTFRPR